MGFFRAKRLAAGATDAPIWASRTTGGNTNGNFVLEDILLNKVTITASPAPGAGAGWDVDFRDNTGAAVSIPVTLSGTATSVSASPGGIILPAYDLVTIANGVRYMRQTVTGAPTATAIFCAIDYTPQVNSNQCMTGIGDSTLAFTTTTTNKFQSFDNSGGDVTTTEANHQCSWPSTGTVGPFIFLWDLTDVTGTTEIAFRKNGADAFAAISFPGQVSTARVATFSSTTFSITAGDLINLRIKRTGSVDGNMRVHCSFGFVAT